MSRKSIKAKLFEGSSNNIQIDVTFFDDSLNFRLHDVVRLYREYLSISRGMFAYVRMYVEKLMGKAHIPLMMKITQAEN